MKSGARNVTWSFLNAECSADVAGLAELIDAGLGRGLFNNDLDFSIVYGRINNKLGGSKVVHLFKQIGINSVVVDLMLLDWDNEAPFYHLLVGV